MAKRLLIIKAASDVCSSEIEHLKAIAEMFGISHCTMHLRSMGDFAKKLCEGSEQYDYIYLAAHANTEFFGESDGSIAIPWHDLATAFCGAGCLEPGAFSYSDAVVAD